MYCFHVIPPLPAKIWITARSTIATATVARTQHVYTTAHLAGAYCLAIYNLKGRIPVSDTPINLELQSMGAANFSVGMPKTWCAPKVQHLQHGRPLYQANYSRANDPSKELPAITAIDILH